MQHRISFSIATGLVALSIVSIVFFCGLIFFANVGYEAGIMSCMVEGIR